jgi:hypothetical protein
VQVAIHVRPNVDVLHRCILDPCAIAVRWDEASCAYEGVTFESIVVGLETAWCTDSRVEIAALCLETLPSVVPKI